jgi:glycolate oxidase
VAGLLNNGIMPSTLEYMDRNAIRVVENYLPLALPQSTGALLLVEVDGDEKSVEEQGQKLLTLLAERGKYPGILQVREAENDREVQDLWKARRLISPATFKLKPHKISEDVVVPRTKIPQLVGFAEELSGKLDVLILTFGHAGDGNIHVNIMVDKENREEYERGQVARKLLFEHVMTLAGTLSGEHGVGITKAPYLRLELDDTSLQVMKKIKNAFDPNNILNPGKIFSEKRIEP